MTICHAAIHAKHSNGIYGEQTRLGRHQPHLFQRVGRHLLAKQTWTQHSKLANRCLGTSATACFDQIWSLALQGHRQRQNFLVSQRSGPYEGLPANLDQVGLIFLVSRILWSWLQTVPRAVSTTMLSRTWARSFFHSTKQDESILHDCKFATLKISRPNSPLSHSKVGLEQTRVSDCKLT